MNGSAKAAGQKASWVDRELQRFKHKNKREDRFVRGVQLLILLALVGLWELAGRMRWIDVLIFSYPSKVFAQIGRDALSGELWPHVGMTVLETVIGFLLGTLVGTLLAVLIWWSPFMSKVLDPYMVVFNSMPKVALGPIFIVVFGGGFTAIVATTLSITVITTTLVVYTSFKETDANYVKVVQSFGGGKRQVFSKVMLPASFPAIVSTLKVNVGLSWVGVIVGEFLVAKIGLGYLIIYGFQVFNFTLVFASLVIIAIVATAMYQLVVYIEHVLVKKR